MSKLIFNPKKDMKELEKYGFVDVEKINGMCKYYSTQDNLTKIKIGKHDGKVWITGFADEELVILYKLIKANLIIEEEELKCANVK